MRLEDLLILLERFGLDELKLSSGSEDHAMLATLRRAIARIDIIQHGSSVSRGTGFLVARDLVLTAMHVVAEDARKEHRKRHHDADQNKDEQAGPEQVV